MSDHKIVVPLIKGLFINLLSDDTHPILNLTYRCTSTDLVDIKLHQWRSPLAQFVAVSVAYIGIIGLMFLIFLLLVQSDHVFVHVGHMNLYYIIIITMHAFSMSRHNAFLTGIELKLRLWHSPIHEKQKFKLPTPKQQENQ